MRLLEIRIKNIASLKGEHEISFREIMEQSPLFAITGETGSGKSTILNSIGLALYGKIFKSSVQQNDVVTLGEKEGQIELLFQAKDKTYLAFWRARVRKQNGEFYSTPQSPTRDLYEVQGDSLDSPKQISDKKVEDILNLDFDQFCKCVILNQGEFAKFLTSSFTDRKEILEKLYPGDVLEGLSGQLRTELEDARRSRDSLDVEMSTLKGVNLIGEYLETERLGTQTELKKNESTLGLLETLDSSYKTLHHYYEENVKNQTKLSVTQNDIKDLTRIQNENFLVLKSSQEVHESAVKSKEKEEPRLQELLKLEEKLLSSRESEKDLILKLTRKEKELEAGSERHGAAVKSLEGVQEKIQSTKVKISSPVEYLKTHQDDLEILLAKELERKHLSEAKALADTRLKELEEAGKEKNAELQLILNKKKELPENLETELHGLTLKKDSVSKESEKKNKALIQETELNLQLENLHAEDRMAQSRLQTLQASAKEKNELASPLRVTLQLSELMNAVEVCRTHPTTLASEVCPVCDTKVDDKKWASLRESLKQNDLGAQKSRLEVLERELIRLDEEEKSLTKQKIQLKATSEQKKKDLLELKPLLMMNLENVSDLEEKIKALGQKSWELKQLGEAEAKLNLSLAKAREDFSTFRRDHQVKIKTLESKEAELSILKEKLKDLISVALDEKLILLLKTDLQLLKELRENERREEKLLHEKSFLEETIGKVRVEVSEYQRDLALMKTSVLEMDNILALELKGEKASEKIHTLNQKVKTTLEDWRGVEARSKKHDLIAKEATSRLQLLGEQSKDLELHFIKAREDIRNAPPHPLSARDTLNRLLHNLKTLSLDLSSPADLYLPLKELLLSEKEFFKDTVLTLRENHAALLARLSDWEKRQDKIRLLELRSKDILEKLARLERLESVLGKDELRTFVLSLVEENLIQQTNQELLKLCQGRYEIIHQSRSRMKLTPEFYVLDKFREGGLRKVATLSGGETFMVSLAMALGLAEMTRGQAEIDSLFIDEGFGTLDQDSLEDVLEMLNQIQTRGLMVGVISHIKGLTNSIPLNLLLSKKQDGTSTLSLQYN